MTRLIKIAARTAALTLATWAVPALAETSSPAAPQNQTGTTSVPVPPTMTTPATTMAPIRAGSTVMHEVPTPVAAKRAVTSANGGSNVGGGGN